MSWAIVTLTSAGSELGLKLQNGIPGSVLYSMPGRGVQTSRDIDGTLKEFITSIFNSYDVIVFIMAAGIVVRTIAGLIKDKSTDPGVLVMDEKGSFVISLLSGHIGGANKCAEYAAGIIGATPVITTSSDVNGMLSPDMLAVKYGAVIDDMKKCRDITASMVNGGRIALSHDGGIEIPEPYVIPGEDADGIVFLTNRKVSEPGISSLHLIPKNIVIGTGCRRDTDPEHLKNFIIEELAILGLDIRSVCCIASIDIKSDEPAVLSAAEFFNAGTIFYTAEKITEVEHLFESSDFVRETTGAGSVSEPCAYLASDCTGRVLLQKKKRNGMTLSIRENALREII